MESKLGKVLKIKIEVMLKKYWTQESEGEKNDYNSNRIWITVWRDKHFNEKKTRKDWWKKTRRHSQRRCALIMQTKTKKAVAISLMKINKKIFEKMLDFLVSKQTIFACDFFQDWWNWWWFLLVRAFWLL